MLHHAGGDRRNVRDLGAAQLERVAGALLARFLGVGEAMRGAHRRQRQRETKNQAGVTNLIGERGGHFQLPLATPWAGPLLMAATMHVPAGFHCDGRHTAHFAEFALPTAPHYPSETSESHGYRQIPDSIAAFDLKSL